MPTDSSPEGGTSRSRRGRPYNLGSGVDLADWGDGPSAHATALLSKEPAPDAAVSRWRCCTGTPSCCSSPASSACTSRRWRCSPLTNVAGAFGVANERRWGYVVALVAAFLPLLLIAYSVIFGGHSYLGGGLLTLIFDLALIALLLHPVSRGYFKIWFR